MALRTTLAFRGAIEIEIVASNQTGIICRINITGSYSQIPARMDSDVFAPSNRTAVCTHLSLGRTTNDFPFPTSSMTINCLRIIIDILIVCNSNILPRIQKKIATRFNIRTCHVNTISCFQT
ncbi:hypothetical protein NB694_004182 [Pantoea ananatis]|nr:hypothetical protein [Pantoea ananatis]